jgi:hypothetical protein
MSTSIAVQLYAYNLIGLLVNQSSAGLVEFRGAKLCSQTN